LFAGQTKTSESLPRFQNNIGVKKALLSTKVGQALQRSG
jgi:hypothetical protein